MKIADNAHALKKEVPEGDQASKSVDWANASGNDSGLGPGLCSLREAVVVEQCALRRVV